MKVFNYNLFIFTILIQLSNTIQTAEMIVRPLSWTEISPRAKPINTQFQPASYDFLFANNKSMHNFISNSQEGNISIDWIQQYASGIAPASDLACDIAIDDSGNVIVTGASTSIPQGFEICTIKYDQAGRQKWITRSGKEAGKIALGTALTIDRKGNVYVTGISVGATTGFDITTIKYNSAGIQQWTVIYNGTNDSNDVPNDVIVDSVGNVYVTGKSGADIITIKYTSNGEQDWIRYYTGSDYTNNKAGFLEYDATGNVIVAGVCKGVESGDDIIVIKYNTNGTERWSHRYNGPDNKNDFLTDMDVDSDGDIYLAGVIEGNDDIYAYMLIKYNASGELKWVSTFGSSSNGYNSIYLTTDYQDNICITGTAVDSNYNSNITIVLYNPDGVQKWTDSFYPQGQSSHVASRDIEADAFGNIFVTGSIMWAPGSNSDFVTLKYNTSGSFQWSMRYDGPGHDFDMPNKLRTDRLGNLYVTGYSRGSDQVFDYATIKYNTTGKEEWTNRYNGPGDSQDEACDLVLDAAGNIYMLGKSLGPGCGDDYLVIKYNAAGEQLWTARYNGPVNSSDIPQHIDVDNSGNVYVTGISLGLEKVYDFATVKFNDKGVEQWVARYTGKTERRGEVAAMVVDKSGNVYITGGTEGPYSQNGYTAIKYNSAGVEQWAIQGDDQNSKFHSIAVSALAVDDSGNVYVTGSRRGSDNDQNMTTIKYNAEGTEQWLVDYDSPVEGAAEMYDLGRKIDIDQWGNIYIVGVSDGIGTNSDLVTLKYNPHGKQQWLARYDGPDHSWEYPFALEVDPSGNIYVAGRSRGIVTMDDFVTVKYDSAGKELWATRYNSQENYDDEIAALAIDEQGCVYVSGSTRGVPTSYFVTIKYTQDGKADWITTWDGPDGNDWVCGVAVDQSENVYVGGESWGLGGVIITTIKYIQTAVYVDTTIEKTSPKSFFLFQNHPNPFNPVTRIGYMLKRSNFVTLKIYDLLGKEVQTLVSEFQKVGNYSIYFEGRGLSSGVYLYQLKAGNEFVATKKMVFIR